MVTPRVFTLLLCLVLLGGCADPPRDSLRFGLTSMPVTLDPRHATDAASSRINRLLYQQLVDFDEQAMPTPSLAHWERLSPTHYRFHLDAAGARFSNGMPLTVADVIATYEYVMDERNGSPHRLSMDNVETIEVGDGDSIEFRLRQADPLFPGRLTLGILPAELIASGHRFNREPVGSGPFAVVGWPDEARLQLRRRHDDQVIEFVAVSDPTVRVLKLLRGEIDMVQSDLPPELVDYLRQRDEVRVEQGAGSNFAYLGFNLRDEVTGDPAVRRAVAHALNRDDIIHYVFDETARPANAMFPPEHWAGADPDAIAHDPDEARRLLAQAGYVNGRAPRIVYTTSTDPFRLRLATIIQRQLTEVGFEVELRSYDWGTFYGDIRTGRFQMYSLMWVGLKLPEIFRYAFHSESMPPAGANRGFFVSATADRLIEQAERAPDIEGQREPLRQLQLHLHEALPFVPLWYEDHVFVTRRDIMGYRIAADGNYDSLVDVRRE